MPRTCHRVAVSFQRRINTRCNKDSRATECRFLHPSDLGINCINETPEGQGCGIVENLAMFTPRQHGRAPGRRRPRPAPPPRSAEPPRDRCRPPRTGPSSPSTGPSRAWSSEGRPRSAWPGVRAGACAWQGLPFDLGRGPHRRRGTHGVSTEVGPLPPPPVPRGRPSLGSPRPSSAAGGGAPPSGPELLARAPAARHRGVPGQGGGAERGAPGPADPRPPRPPGPRGTPTWRSTPSRRWGLLSASQP